MTKFITFAPFLTVLTGHCYDYHLLLNEVAKKNGYEPRTYIPTESEIENLPNHWMKELHFCKRWSVKAFIPRNLPFLVNFKHFTKLLKSTLRILKKERGEKILLLETFNTFHLYALLLSRLYLQKTELYLIYRYEPRQLFFKGKKDRIVIDLLKKSGIKVTLFADTESLIRRLEPHFSQKVHLLPIPHTEGLYQQKRAPQEEIILWWPGRPRRPKGLSEIEKLIQRENKTPMSFKLRVSEDVKIQPVEKGLSIETTSHFLTREQYLNYFKDVDVILLPYSSFDYRSSSSGIFIEAILAKIIVLSSDGTWISDELRKHKLKELIVDFNSIDVFEKILALRESQEVAEKLAQMQSAYLKFHNFDQFRISFQKCPG
jgi:hypothetical protein